MGVNVKKLEAPEMKHPRVFPSADGVPTCIDPLLDTKNPEM